MVTDTVEKIDAAKVKKAKSKLTGTKAIVYCGLFAAILVALSQISFYIGVIPITLGLLGVLLCGSLLGTRWGTITVLVYITMGLVGIPVFVGFKSSAALLGPTGGYIIGYVFSALLAGLAGRFSNKTTLGKADKAGNKAWAVNKIIMFALLYAAVVVCYLFGTAWYYIYVKFYVATNTGITFMAALSTCVFPFVPGDAIKVVICGLLTIRLKPVLNKA